MISIFKKEQFKVCMVPVPTGYPQSQTHAGVFYNDGIVYLTSSPFPVKNTSKCIAYLKACVRKITNGKFCKLIIGETYENPCLYTQVYHGATCEFKLMQAQPLMDQPTPYYGYPSFNSDPDIFVEDGYIYVLNRCVFRTKLTPGRHRDEYEIRLYLIKGAIDGDKFKLYEVILLKESNELSVSPCITKYGNRYLLMQLYTNCYNDGQSFNGLRYIEDNTIRGLQNTEQWNKIQVNSGVYLPWHMSLFENDGILYSIAACIKRGEPHKCYQMLGQFSSDLKEFHVYQTPLTDYNSYRGSAYVSEDGIIHLYSTTVNEKVPGGMSVDGREVIYASMNFNELIHKLKDNENSDFVYG